MRDQFFVKENNVISKILTLFRVLSFLIITIELGFAGVLIKHSVKKDALLFFDKYAAGQDVALSTNYV